MKGDTGIVGFLNRALKHELTAVSQFWLHYRLLKNWGATRLADKLREESIEEMRHADELIARIVFLEGLPELQHLDPLMIGENVREVLDCDLRAEYSARNIYREARAACREVGDYVSMELFERLMADEEGHIDFLETQLDLCDRIGNERYIQLNSASADGED